MNILGVKSHGVVYTPAPIVELILENVLPREPDGLANAVICDPACGDGAFLTAVARHILCRLPKAEALPVLDRLTGYDIDRTALAQCRAQLDAILTSHCPDAYVDWNLCERNALDRVSFQQDTGRFTHVVGNPPYVRVQHLEHSGRRRISGRWNVIRGATDLYLVFYELGLDLLRSGGTLGYITPSSWLRSDSGAELRRWLTQSHQVKKIVDFGQYQVFGDVTTYTAITVIRKDGIPADISVLKFDGSQFHDAGLITLDHENPSRSWTSATQAERERLRQMAICGLRLSEVADIHVGIQTLADSVFIRPVAEASENQWHSVRRLLETRSPYASHLPWQTDDGTMMLERWIMRPIVKASVLKEGHDPVQRAVIFPYDDNGKLLPESYIADNAPAAYEWLLIHKSRLLNRDKGQFDPARWYAFGRHVSITSGFGPKILTSGMNKHPNFQLYTDPNATFYSGYCVKPRSGVDTFRLLDTLNSDDMDFFIRHTSRPYQGGWMSYAKSFIKDFPVPHSILE